MRRLLSLLASIVAIGIGLITVIGLLSGYPPGLAALILQLTVTLVGMATLIGVANLVIIHLRRVATVQRGFVYSVVLLASMALVIVLWATGANAESLAVLENVQVSAESALAGLLLFALVFGAYRLMRRRATLSRVLFTLALLIVLVGALPLPQAGAIAGVRDWLLAVPVSAGARGLLIGVALAAVVAGVRVLIGQDLSYRE